MASGRATGDYAFGSELRLCEAAEYERVFADARRLGGRSVTLLMRANELGHPRLGLAISRKRLRRAVDRNRLKRHVRETFRHLRHRLPAVDCVVLARQDAATMSAAELHADLERLWQKAVHALASPHPDSRT